MLDDPKKPDDEPPFRSLAELRRLQAEGVELTPNEYERLFEDDDRIEAEERRAKKRRKREKENASFAPRANRNRSIGTSRANSARAARSCRTSPMHCWRCGKLPNSAD